MRPSRTAITACFTRNPVSSGTLGISSTDSSPASTLLPHSLQNEASDATSVPHCVQYAILDHYSNVSLKKVIAVRLYFFSQGMEKRSEEFLSGQGLTVRLASLEDIFLFKTVAERRDDIDDMAAPVQTDLDFEAIRDEIAVQAELLGGERFTTIISESLGRLEYRHGIQTPLDEAIDEYYERYMSGYELRTALDKETPQTIEELAADLDIDESATVDRIDHLEQFDFVERVDGGIVSTVERDRFQRN